MTHQAHIFIRAVASLAVGIAILVVSFASSYEPNCDFGTPAVNGGPTYTDIIVGCPLIVPTRWAGHMIAKMADNPLQEGRA